MKTASRGFTLVELMVALAVFSSAVSLVLFGLEQGRQQWHKTTARMEKQGTLFNRERWLATMLEEANASLFPADYAQSTPYFEGEAESFSFMTNAPILGGPGTYAAVRLHMQRNNGHYQLYYIEAVGKDPYYGLQAALSRPGILLMDDITGFSLRYLAPENIGQIDWAPTGDGQARRDRPEWLPHFSSRLETTMPILVNLRFTLLGGEEQDWYFPVNRHSYSADPLGEVHAN